MKKKNLFLGVLAMTSMLFVTSCSEDDFQNNGASGDYVDAKFKIEMAEGIGTRAATNVGQGSTVNHVACAIYDADGNELPALRQYVAVSNKEAEYSVRLVKGQAYRVAFFAYYGDDKGASDYYDMTALTDIKIKDAAANIEQRDAFTNYVDVTADETTGAIDKSVSLYRPFAQLNLGSTAADVEAAKNAGVVVTNSEVTVSNVYTEFDAYNNTVAEGAEAKEVTFLMNEIPGEDLMVDVDNDATTADEAYEYLALNYILVGDKGNEKALTDVKFTWKTADGKTNSPATEFKNVPVQRNYRTNIIGSLLTNPAVFNITIDAAFQTPDNIVAAPWDGTTVTEPKLVNNEYLISTPAEWVWLKTGRVQSGTSLKLTADLDFGGHEVKGIAGKNFDGQGHTMSNMVLLPGGSAYSNGLFQGDATSGDITVKNVTFDNVKAECSDPAQGYIGVVFGDLQNGNLTLENVHVKNADLCGVQSVGGLVGFVASGKTVTTNNCSVEDSYIHNYAVENESGYVAGFVGRFASYSGTVNATSCEVRNTLIEGYYVTRRGASSIAEVVGGKTNVDGVTVTGVTVNKTHIDAVASTTEELTAALSSVVKKDILLKEGEFELGGVTIKASTVNIFSEDKTKSIVKLSKSLYADGKTINLKNITFTVPAGLTYDEAKFAFIHRAAELNMQDCVVDGGRLRINVSKAVIDNCQFNVTTSDGFDGYGLFYYGNTGSEVTVKNCTFDTAGKAIVIYSEGANVYNLDVNDCEFTSSVPSTDKAAIQMHTEYGISGTLDITNSTATGFANVNGGLWNELNNNTKEPTTKFTVTVDGDTVQEAK